MPTRRSLLQSAGLAAVTAMTPIGAIATPAKESPMSNPGAENMPGGLTLLAIKQGDGTETLGIKTASGVLDVVKANAILNLHAPVTLEEMLRSGDAGALNALAKSAEAFEARA